MGDVILFRKKTVTASPANRNQVLARANAATPAWVTRHPELNATVAILRREGWRVDCYVAPRRILCFHPRVDNNNGVNIIDAAEIQMVFMAQKNGGAA